ncbi:MAG TPA: hypothetical protein VFX96_12070 [Pyrinomonadaceae bacterium]|nr:hypothetical protein [Pyrinomonadaceae bacterium]
MRNGILLHSGARAVALASLLIFLTAAATTRAVAQAPSATPAATPAATPEETLSVTETPDRRLPALTFPKPDQKAQDVLTRAVEAMGGPAYAAVTTVVSRGNFTPYADGIATVPIQFTDYLVFPDHERTEFKGSALRSVETYAGERGWLYDGMKLTIRDATPEQMRNFRIVMRTSIDNILRGWWVMQRAALTYVGRREAGLGRRNEVVRLTYPDGFSVEFEFGARDGLPSKVIYRKPNAEGEEVEEEDRYAQFLNIGGVVAPFVIDHFRAGTQTSRVNYQTVEFNRPVPDALFARPADGKTFKY